jgi:hypothetical protein
MMFELLLDLYAGTFFQPALSYIPNPGANPKFDGAWS